MCISSSRAKRAAPCAARTETMPGARPQSGTTLTPAALASSSKASSASTTALLPPRSQKCVRASTAARASERLWKYVTQLSTASWPRISRTTRAPLVHVRDRHQLDALGVVREVVRRPEPHPPGAEHEHPHLSTLSSEPCR